MSTALFHEEVHQYNYNRVNKKNYNIFQQYITLKIGKDQIEIHSWKHIYKNQIKNMQLIFNKTKPFYINKCSPIQFQSNWLETDVSTK